jgi:hypothetical protein
MKKIFFTLFLTSICSIIFAQSRVSQIEYMKEYKEGISVDIPFPEKTVYNALTDTLQKVGYKGKEVKGALTYKGAILRGISEELLDYYFIIDKKSKKEKDITTISMLISKNLETSFLSEAGNEEIYENAKKFLNAIVGTVNFYDLDLQIKDQLEVLTKSQKKLNSLIEDGQDLDKKKKKLDEQIQQNIKSQATQKGEVDVQTQVLETLKIKRKS